MGSACKGRKNQNEIALTDLKLHHYSGDFVGLKYAGKDHSFAQLSPSMFNILSCIKDALNPQI